MPCSFYMCPIQACSVFPDKCTGDGQFCLQPHIESKEYDLDRDMKERLSKDQC